VRCIVTAGPTFEPLDRVRRLTNFSTGRLGTELANYLAERGHQVTLLVGAQATWPGPRLAGRVVVFTTGADLARKLRARSGQRVDALFHAAAVGDFAFGRIWRQTAAGRQPIRSPKLSTRQGSLLIELVPTPKILPQLRGWFPRACVVGWKYEVAGGARRAVALAVRQIQESGSHACVANGPACGKGFVLVRSRDETRRVVGKRTLFSALERLAGTASRPARPSRRGVPPAA